MQFRRGVRSISALAVAVMATGLLSVAMLGTAAVPAGAATAADDASFRAAYEDETVALIDVTTDIQMDCGAGTFYRSSAADQPLVINGNGHTISAAGCGAQVLFNDVGDLTLDDVVVTGGDYSLDGSLAGGGIQSNGGTLTLNRSTVTGNRLTSLGDDASVAIGAGVWAADLVLNRSSVTANVATCETCQSTSGGGVYVANDATLVNSTVSANSATSPNPDRGGGVRAENVTLVYSTVADNTADTGANVYANDVLTSFGSVVAYASDGDSCDTDATTSNGYSYDDDGTCGFGAGPGDVSDGPDPLLGALAPSGILPVHTPQTGSPLIDAIPAAACSADGASTIVPLVDELGTNRPQGPGCDIGAVEVPVLVPAPVDLAPNFTG